MISEIARRVPGPGIGLGIPIGMGGGGGGAEGGADEAAGAGGEDVSEQVAATDSAIDADRQATVASSGMMDDGGDSDTVDDPNSPSALFGDAAPDKDVGISPSGDDASFTTDATEPTFGMDDESFTTESTLDEPTFDDGSSFSSSEDDFSQQEGEFFGEDPGSTTDFGSDAATEEGGSSLLETLWDLFMGGDD